MEQNSPMSNIEIGMSCPECEHHWQLLFDVIPYLKSEIDQWAKRFLNQVALLSQTFGWSEEAVITMSDVRRNYYLNLIVS